MTGPLTGLLDKYPYIVFFGLFNDSTGWHINDELERANLEDAPHTAVYKRDDGTWQVMEDYDPLEPFALYAAQRGIRWQKD